MKIFEPQPCENQCIEKQAITVAVPSLLRRPRWHRAAPAGRARRPGAGSNEKHGHGRPVGRQSRAPSSFDLGGSPIYVGGALSGSGLLQNPSPTKATPATSPTIWI